MAVLVYHPNQSVNGIPASNFFYVCEDNQAPLGFGYLICNYCPDLFPERPLQIYFNVQAMGAGQHFVFGALLARAQTLREQNPAVRMRVYAQVNDNDPNRDAKLAFYEGCGLKDVDGLDILQIHRPNAWIIPPMGYRLMQTSTATENDRRGLIGRMNHYRLNPWNMAQLSTFMNYPYFFAMTLCQSNEIVGEAVFTGGEGQARLLGLYVIPKARRHGFAKLMLSAGIKRLEENGVSYVDSEYLRSSEAQKRLADSCGGKYVRTGCIYPGYNYD